MSFNFRIGSNFKKVKTERMLTLNKTPVAMAWRRIVGIKMYSGIKCYIVSIGWTAGVSWGLAYHPGQTQILEVTV